MHQVPKLMPLVNRVLAVALIMTAVTAMQVHSQPHLRFQRFSQADGLSDLTINSIAQDSTGFLWIATRDGLNRYDGTRFKVFKHVLGDSTSLVHDNVQCVFVDSRGAVWVGTTRGLCRYDPSRNAFQRIPIASPKPAVPDINAITEDASGTLWLAVAGVGLAKIERPSGRGMLYQHDPADRHSISSNSLRCVVVDPAGMIWTGSLDAGLNRFDPLTGRATRFIHDPRDPTSIGGGRIEGLRVDPKGNLWVGTENGALCRFDPQRGTFVRFTRNPRNPRSISSNYVTSIFFDHAGALWVGTQGGGLNRTESYETAEFTSYVYNHTDPCTISDDYVGCIFEDRERVLWIGTGSGLNRLLPHSSVFVHVNNKVGTGPIIAGGSVSSVLKDRSGILWVGTGNGLTRIIGRTSRHFLHGATAADAIEVAGLHEDRSGALWVATSSLGLARIDPATSRSANPRFTFWTHDPQDPLSISSNRILCIREDRNGTLWIGTNGAGLNKMERTSGTFLRYQHNPGDSTSLSDNTIMAIMQDSRGLLWVCTMRGLNTLDPATGRFTRYAHNDADVHSLPNRVVYGAVEGTDGNMWVATARGLGVLDIATGRFTNYFTGDGLPDVFLKGITADLTGTIWISSRSGLSRVLLNPDGRIRFRNYQASDGLPVEDFSPIAYSTASDGELLFGANDGLVRFYPEHLRISATPPVITISGIRVFDTELPLAATMTLTSDQYDFSVEFSAMDYSNPQRNQFEYILEGLDRHWIAAGKSRSARYANLAPGDYTFRVRGTNSDGVWNSTGATLSVTILPPYWATWWFRTLAIVAGAGLLVLAYRYRVRRLLEVERLRLRISADLHDELASNLSSIALFSSILKEGQTSAKEHPQLLERISSLAHESLASIKHIIWAIDTRVETLADLVVRLRDTMSGPCRAKNIVLRIDGPVADDHRVSLGPEQRRHLWLMLKEAITNAVKHSGGTEVVIRAERHRTALRIEVHDNGCGFDATPRRGKGLSTMRMRAEELKGTVTVESLPGKGTRLLFHIKL